MPPDLKSQIDAIITAPGGDGDLRCLALIHGCACIGRFDAVCRLLEVAGDRGLDARRVEEAAVQVVAFGGIPRALHTLGLVAANRPGEAATGSLSVPGNRAEQGRRVWDAIYADQSSAVLASLERLVPGLSECVVEDAYGRILARPGLSLVERELLAVAALALMELPRPLESHIRGALRNGSPVAGVEDILRTSRPWAPSPGASEVVDQALDRLSRKVYER